MDVTNREIDGVVFMLAGRDRNRCLVTTKYNRNEHRSMCRGVRPDSVLQNMLSTNASYLSTSAYTLIPCPIPTHKVSIFSLPTFEVMVWGVVDAGGKLGVCDYVVDKFSGTTIPQLVLRIHPFRRRTVIRADPLVLRSI